MSRPHSTTVPTEERMCLTCGYVTEHRLYARGSAHRSRRWVCVMCHRRRTLDYYRRRKNGDG
ncbi:MAG TPA: hypothetical protein VGK43_04445 [Solirubrobacterales bacterium]